MVRKTIIVIVVLAVFFIIAMAVLSLNFPKTISYGDKVAIIKLRGVLSSQSSIVPSAQTEPASFINLLEEAENDPTIKAVVIEINSPGGSPVASDEIAAKIKAINKTIVAYISDFGASGAYWVASSADKIVAHPLSITCSIGAFTTVSDWSVFFQKIGMNNTVVKAGEYKDIGNIYRPMREDEEKILQKMIDEVQSYFIDEVSKNRKLSQTQIDKIKDGRPCLGKYAFAYGLVDRLGTQDDALKLAEELANIKKPKVVTLEERKGLFASLFGADFTKEFYSIGLGIAQGMKGEGDFAISS